MQRDAYPMSAEIAFHGRDTINRQFSAGVAAPEGRLGNSPALQCRGRAQMVASPGGTAEITEITDVSVVPPGLGPFLISGPGTEVPGYYQSVPAGRFFDSHQRRAPKSRVVGVDA